MVRNHASMKAEVYTAPDSLDVEIARTKLAAMGVTIDDLTDEQRAYITGWQEGT
jgi:adenosylhomocysteinase